TSRAREHYFSNPSPIRDDAPTNLPVPDPPLRRRRGVGVGVLGPAARGSLPVFELERRRPPPTRLPPRFGGGSGRGARVPRTPRLRESGGGGAGRTPGGVGSVVVGRLRGGGRVARGLVRRGGVGRRGERRRRGLRFHLRPRRGGAVRPLRGGRRRRLRRRAHPEQAAPTGRPPGAGAGGRGRGALPGREGALRRRVPPRRESLPFFSLVDRSGIGGRDSFPRSLFLPAPQFEPALDENGEFEIVPEPAYLEELAAEAEGHDYHGRALQNQNGCAANQVRARVVVRTDNTGWENSWAVRRSNNALVAKGPRGQTKYGSNQSYAGGICLGPGTYKFTVRDSFRDGMCGGSTGKGYYRFFLDGVQRFTSPASCSDNWSVRTHTFTVKPQTIDLGGGDNAAQIASAGRGGCSNVKIQFQVDKFGKETVVKLVGNGVTHLISNKEVASYGSKTMEKCVPPGTYKFTLTDQDGLCCKYGKGYYKLFEGGELLVKGGFFVGSKTYTIQVGKNWRSDMSARDLEWLAAHNKKRKKYNGGAGFRPMRWSTSLARNAENYAAQIGKTCSALIHAKGVSNGENLARNTGTGGFSQKYSADAIMSRWVDRELTWPYPKNAHYLQVVWRSSLYVGCGEHVSDRGGGALCRTQVCRYVRAGNCQVMNGNWQSEAWKDDTRCGDPCPQEGCYKY
ncbi:hypothetical protein ACHAWF_003562, partial [Thalassiosira exigua]